MALRTSIHTTEGSHSEIEARTVWRKMSHLVLGLFVKVLLVHFSVATLSFATVAPSVWTNTYVAMVTEIDPNNTDAGDLYTTSSKNESADLWLNARKQTKGYNIPLGGSATFSLSKHSIVPSGSFRNVYGYSLISQESLGVFFRDRWTFFQLREMHHLSMEYSAVTYHPQETSMLSVICVCGLFDFTTVTMTFRDEINVTEIAGGFAKVSGQKASFKKVRYREVVQLTSIHDLSGTVITSSSDVAVIAGSMSADPENRLVFLDHMIKSEDTGTEYIVWGLPDLTGSDVCRVVAQASNTDITFRGNDITRLSNTGDYHDFSISRNNFTHIYATKQVLVTMMMKMDDADMTVALPMESMNTSMYTFVTPSRKSDTNFRHFVVVTTKVEGRTDMRLNGEEIPMDIEWVSISGTDYIGAYIPLIVSTERQYIANVNNVPFNAYLVGYGDTGIYGSALLSSVVPESTTQHLDFSLERSYCQRTNQVGNYLSGNTRMEVSDVKIFNNRRKVSYDIKHLRMMHAQACQVNCFLYKNCIGVNFNSVSADDSVNCDLVMKGKSSTVSNKSWKMYTMK